jgi:hypothetical protein
MLIFPIFRNDQFFELLLGIVTRPEKECESLLSQPINVALLLSSQARLLRRRRATSAKLRPAARRDIFSHFFLIFFLTYAPYPGYLSD